MNVSMTVSKDEFKAVMGRFAAGVTIVTTIDPAGRKWGMTATAFTSLSMDPPLCLVCIDKRAGSHTAVTAAKKFAVNMLNASQEAMSNKFASRSEDKFADVSHEAGGASGCPIIAGALAYMECELEAVHPGGDHDIFVGRLVASSVGEGAPLLYWNGGYGNISQGS